MSELPTSVEPDCVYLAHFGQHTNMFIPSSDLSNIEVIEESNLSRRIPLLSVTYIYDL